MSAKSLHCVLTSVAVLLASSVVHAAELSGTKPLTIEGDLARQMVDGIHTYLDRELAAAPKNRDTLWQETFASEAALRKALPGKRERLKQILGVVDTRMPANLEFVGGPDRPPLLATLHGCRIHPVRWNVLRGVDAEGILIEPDGTPKANVVAIPHADQLPEQLAGLVEGDDFALRLARQGCRVLIPTLIDRGDQYSGNARLNRWTNYTHREWIHRMAYEMGRTVSGFEVQKVLSAVDWFEKQNPKQKIGVVGHGDGGMLALYAGALDDRIAAIQVSGYFGTREKLWEEPIDRNVWDRVREFGDAEMAAMIHPRTFLPDNSIPAPTWDGPKVKPARAGAAPGKLSAEIEAHREEMRYQAIMTKLLGKEIAFRRSASPATQVGIDLLLSELQLPVPAKRDAIARPQLNPAWAVERHKRQFDQLVAFTQNLWRNSEPIRKEFWKKAVPTSADNWEALCEPYRQFFHEEAIGKLPAPTMPANPRSRQIYDTPKWVGHELVLDCYPDVIAYGILLMPRDLKPGEKRPVVVCQHGLEGRPTDVCDPTKRTRAYNSYAAQLADRGYIVFAPQNPYIFETHFRQIMRKANPLRLSLFSFIIRQHERIIDWLETHPNVDPKRIAFYGLSYGGKTAMRVPAIEKRYCLSICSGDFNEWIGKIVSTELPMSYMFTREYDMLEYNMGHTFNYAEMAFLIAPRPFMVERGHDDGVGIDEWISYEFAKVRYLYANKLKIPHRTTIEYFVGVHEINGKGTFDFLDKHLNYTPTPSR